MTKAKIEKGKDLQYKTIDIVQMKVFSENGKKYMTGYANTKGHADSYGDIPMSLNGEPVYDLARMKTNPVAFIDHLASASNIAGNFVELQEDEKGLRFKLLFRELDDIYSNEVKDAVSAFITGFGRALSIGGKWIHGDDNNPAHLTKAIIYEISLVGICADAQALSDMPYPKSFITEEVKTVVPWASLPKQLADQSMAWGSSAAVARWRTRSGSEDEPSTSYKNNFLWYDRENEENFGAYKLPIGDIVDGSHKAVPRGIFAARAALAGARGGVDIPDSDRPGVEANVNRYYEKMGLERPFGKGAVGTWSETEMRNLAKSDFDFVIRNCSMSRSSAKYIASLVFSANESDRTRGEEEAKDAKELLDFMNEVNAIFKK